MIGSLLGAGIGTALSLWQENERKNAERDAINQKLEYLNEAKIDDDERALLESSINRNFNTQGISQANATAYGLEGVLNADTLRGLNASNILGQRASALANLDQNIIQQNNQIESMKANLPTVSPTNIGSVIGGGFLGFQAGEAIDKLYPELGENIFGLFGKGNINDVNSDYQEPIPNWIYQEPIPDWLFNKNKNIV